MAFTNSFNPDGTIIPEAIVEQASMIGLFVLRTRSFGNNYR